MRIIPTETTLYIPRRAPLLIVPRGLVSVMASHSCKWGNDSSLIELEMGARASLNDALRYYDARDVQVFVDKAYGDKGELIVRARASFSSLEHAYSEDE